MTRRVLTVIAGVVIAGVVEGVIAGIPQGSIERPLLFNLFVNDLVLFLYTTVLNNYADDNNLFTIGNDKEETKRALVKDFQTVINCFYENYMNLTLS